MMNIVSKYRLKGWAGLLIIALSFSGADLVAQTNAESIDVPPEMERNFDQLLVDWRKNMKKSSTCELMEQGNISYHDSVYINRLHSFPSQMELAFNSIVRSYIDMYTNRNRNSVAVMLGKGRYYNPIFENALDKYGLPNELKYLPVIESAINPVAVSRAGATGLWQFMAATGKMYDLEVNSLVDERRDPQRSTDAAARYLRDLFDIYGDWNLVIAAYNCGPGNVNKAIRRSGGQTDYWAIYPYLPRETRGYVPAFIAATYAMNYHEKHNICAMDTPLPLSVDTLMVNYNVHFEQISHVLNIPVDNIRELNPQYKRDMIPGEYKAYSLCLPSKKTMDYISKRNEIIAYKPEELLTHRKTVEPEGVSTASSVSSDSKIHRVKRGETLASVAKRYGITVNQIKRWNNLRSTKLTVGKRLVVSNPVKAQPVATNAKKTSTTTKTDEENQTVQNQSSSVLSNYFEKQKSKETSNVSDTTGVSETGVREKKYADSESSTIYHKVKIGETMTSIAKRYGVSVADIKKWNKLSTNVSEIGQRLLINIPPKKEEVKTVQVEQANDELQSLAPAKKETVKTQPAKKVVKKTTHSVKGGETLSKIASKYSVSINSIKRENGLKSDRLKIGQKLVIPRK